MKFVIATGGTGGHMFPAFQVAEELKRGGHGILFLGSFGRAQEQMDKSGFAFEELGTKGFITSSFARAWEAVLVMAKGIAKASARLKRFRPDAVLGFGGYGAFPVVLAAIVLRIPTIIHEQNVVPGRANAILAKFVKKIAISFSESAKYFDSQKTILTGCPCHLPQQTIDRPALLSLFQLKEHKTTILVFGGSQGSRVINQGFMASARALKEILDFQVIHICGKDGYEYLKEGYHHLGIPFALFEFLDKMKEAYTIADLVISRSGAATVSELAHFQLPAILIPYPYAQGHQKENAAVLCRAGLAQMIHSFVSRLNEAILDILKNKGSHKKIADLCFPDAAQRLAQAVLSLTT